MDAPPGYTFEDLTKLTKNRKTWREIVYCQDADIAPCSVEFIEAEKTATEKLTEKKAWDEVFRDIMSSKKSKLTRHKRKKT